MIYKKMSANLTKLFNIYYKVHSNWLTHKDIYCKLNSNVKKQYLLSVYFKYFLLLNRSIAKVICYLNSIHI